MSENFVIVRNITSSPIPCFIEGVDWSFEPTEEKVIEARLAQRIKAAVGTLVTILEEAQVDVEKEAQVVQTYWLANMTGDPLAPDEVDDRVRDWEGRGYKTIRVPNPKKTPRILRRRQSPSEKGISLQDGLYSSRMEVRGTIELRPFQRRQFDPAIAQHWLQRDGSSGQSVRGSTIRCRAPNEVYEPRKPGDSDAWPLNKLRAWLSFCNKARARLIPSEEDVKVSSKPQELAAKLHKAKLDAYKHCFFHFVDPDKNCPSESMFNEYYANFTGNITEDQGPQELADGEFELDAPAPAVTAPEVRRTRGRPRKETY